MMSFLSTAVLFNACRGEEILSLIKEKLAAIPSIRYILIRNAIFQKEALVIFVTTETPSIQLKECAEVIMAVNPVIKGVVANINPLSQNTILSPHFYLLSGKPYIFEKLLNKIFKISPSAFFQVNADQTEQLYKKVLALAEIQSHESVLDAYCGVGTLSIFAAESAKYVHGIECIPNAIKDAKENARLNLVQNCLFTCGRAEELIKSFGHFDIVFLNPPRKGCDSKLLNCLLKMKPKKIIYISCDPATLARDLAVLHNRYVIETIQPFDMFPQTMHVETVVRLILQK